MNDATKVIAFWILGCSDTPTSHFPVTIEPRKASPSCAKRRWRDRATTSPLEKFIVAEQNGRQTRRTKQTDS
jgi:hypothetical protein